MAGSNPGFNPRAFRDAIESTMVMGLPQNEDERATFHFPALTIYEEKVGADWVEREPGDLLATGVALRIDQNGNPLQKEVKATKRRPDPVQVPVAVEYNPTGNADERPVGSFRQTRVRITVLDRHWNEIEKAVEVELGGDLYVISFHHPPVGLFEVTVYAMECFARNEK